MPQRAKHTVDARNALASRSPRLAARSTSPASYDDHASSPIRATAIQCAGLGPLTPNTVMMGWPWWWRSNPAKYVPEFLSTIHQATLRQKALLVCHNVKDFPKNDEPQRGFIDIWWIKHDVRPWRPLRATPRNSAQLCATLRNPVPPATVSSSTDGRSPARLASSQGGLLLLISHLLQKHRVWRRCGLRLHLITEVGTNPEQLKQRIHKLLSRINITATVEEVHQLQTRT